MSKGRTIARAAGSRDGQTGAEPTAAVPGWQRDEERLLARATRLRAEIAGIAGPGAGIGVPQVDCDEPWRCPETVAALSRCCVDLLRAAPVDPGEARAGAVTPAVERIGHLLVEAQELALDLHRHEMGLRARRLADSAAGLARLRLAPSSGALVDQLCGELARCCGFGRAVLSRVSDGMWRPWTAHFRDPAEHDGWFAEWVDRPIPVEAAGPEMYLLAEREPTIVSDTGDAAVYRPIIVDAGRSRSYVAAPVIAGDEVVGFLHADHLPSSRRVDETDRDALWAFADGFGRIYERTVLLERLRAQRDQVREMLASTDDMLDEMCGPGIDLRAAADRVAPRPVEADGGAVAARLRELTTREREVLGLMAAGLTNPAIAERLVISEDTVKTHVKHVLRKLGAANRAKAIAMASGVRGTGGPQA